MTSNALRVEVHRPGIDVDEHRLRADERDDVRRRRERVRGHDHLVAGADSEREHGEVQRGGSRRDGDGVLHLARARHLGLELGDLRAHRELPRREHLGDLRELVGADVGPG